MMHKVWPTKVPRAFLILVNAYVLFLLLKKGTAFHNITMGLLLLCLIMLGLKCGRRFFALPERGFLWLYGIFFGTILLASLLCGDWNSICDAFQFLWISTSFWLMYFVFRRFLQPQQIAWAVLLGSVILPVASCCSFVLEGFNRFATEVFNLHPNRIAALMALYIPLMWMALRDLRQSPSKEHRWLLWLGRAGLAIAVVAMFLTGSRGCIIGFLVGGATVCFLRFLLHRFSISAVKLIAGFFLIIAALGIGGGMLMIHHFGRISDVERVYLAKSCYHMWQDHKLYGVGFSRWAEEYHSHYVLPEAKEPELGFAHNIVTQSFATTGTIGGVGALVFLLGMFVLLLRRIHEQPDNIYLQMILWGYIGILAHGLVNSAFGVGDRYVERIFFGFLGLALATADNQQSRQEEQGRLQIEAEER